tara:strand:- start:1695 stop:1826 length:132 start_codon:yes stop_codon:yes gene_type:complete
MIMSNLIFIAIGLGLGLVVSGIGLLILLKWDNEHYLKIKRSKK